MNVRIQLTGGFQVEVDGTPRESMLGRSRKGLALIRYLILQRGRAVSSQRLIRELDPEGQCENPENAMKTLVSRTRALLNGICGGLGGCIRSESGSYRWEALAGVWVDVTVILELLEKLRRRPDEDTLCSLSEALVDAYRGELEGEYWLQREYLEAVYAYASVLRQNEWYNQLLDLCTRALRIDDMDEELHILRMEALLNLNRAEEAMEEYHRVARQSEEYFDSPPSEALTDCYQALLDDSKSLKFNLDAIHNELTREDETTRGPFFCEYRAFREIYNIQIRNPERLGSTMFLGVVMLSGKTVASREGGMAVLLEILKSNLRRGDIVTRFSDNIVAMLLPTVNYVTGSAVMERIEKLFYSEYPSTSVSFHARISPMGGSARK